MTVTPAGRHLLVVLSITLTQLCPCIARAQSDADRPTVEPDSPPFFLRASAGSGWAWFRDRLDIREATLILNGRQLSEPAVAKVDGPVAMLEVLAGGEVAAVNVGAGVSGHVLFRSEVELEGQEYPTGATSWLIAGVAFADYRFPGASRVSLQGTMGLGVATMDGSGGLGSTIGYVGSAGAAYDLFTSTDWHVGVLGRLHVAVLGDDLLLRGAEPGEARERLTIFSPTLALTASWE